MKLIFIILLGVCLTCLASAANPPKGYKLFPDYTISDPDRSFRIEQYANEDWNWQIWVYPHASNEGYLLTRPDDYSGYGSSFELSPNSTWLFRSQKIGSGTHTAYLYKRDKGINFSPLTTEAIGDLAWGFMAQQPGIVAEQIPTFHKAVDFVEWRHNRYLIIALSGIHFLDDYRWITNDWVCAFDLEKKQFIVLPDLAKKNIGKIYKIKNKKG